MHEGFVRVEGMFNHGGARLTDLTGVLHVGSTEYAEEDKSSKEMNMHRGRYSCTHKKQLENLGTVFYFIPLRHLSCRKTTISTEQEYNVSKTKSGYSAGPLNGEHIAKLPYFA